jgi:glycerophosphoryl diester phosphodiesterase
MIVWTHRGNPGPENTLEAFEQAWKDGIRHFETDIHVTKDGTLVLAHDSNIKRLTGRDEEIINLTFEELNRNPVMGLYRWCSLDALITAFPEVIVSIDIKNDASVKPFITWLRTRDFSNFVVGSFSSKRVNQVRKEFPLLRTALTPKEVHLIRLGLQRIVNLESADKFAMIPQSMYGLQILTKRFIASCQRLNIAIYVWTINSVAEGRELENLGVQGIVTDDYALFKQSL